MLRIQSGTFHVHMGSLIAWCDEDAPAEFCPVSLVQVAVPYAEKPCEHGFIMIVWILQRLPSQGCSALNVSVHVDMASFWFCVDEDVS